jgi:hypothetical protein
LLALSTISPERIIPVNLQGEHHPAKEKTLLWRPAHWCRSGSGELFLCVLFDSPGYVEGTLHSPKWILGITRIAGDHMAMAVPNGLAGGSSDIETDIVPRRCLCFLDHPLAVAHKVEYRIFFLPGQGKKILNMAERDYQHMTP